MEKGITGEPLLNRQAHTGDDEMARTVLDTSTLFFSQTFDPSSFSSGVC